MSPLFGKHHDSELPDPAPALQHFQPLTAPQRAAEVLAGIGTDSGGQSNLLEQWLPDVGGIIGSVDPPDEWWDQRQALKDLLDETFWVLQLARLVIRHEETSTTYGDAGTHVTYRVSADGRAALDRGDAAAVVARRVPD